MSDDLDDYLQGSEPDSEENPKINQISNAIIREFRDRVMHKFNTVIPEDDPLIYLIELMVMYSVKVDENMQQLFAANQISFEAMNKSIVEREQEALVNFQNHLNAIAGEFKNATQTALKEAMIDALKEATVNANDDTIKKIKAEVAPLLLQHKYTLRLFLGMVVILGLECVLLAWF